MKFKHLLALITILAVGMLSGCKSEIDLKNIDTTAEVGLGLALPIGNVHMTIFDMVGNIENLYVDSQANRGVLTWKLDTVLRRDYHKMDLAKYLSKACDTLEIYNQLATKISQYCSDNGMPDFFSGGNFTTPVAVPVEFEFRVDMPLTGINKDKTIKERLDRALIEDADFYSVMSTYNCPFSFAWMDSVVLDLGPRFDRPAGNHVVVYPRKAGAPAYKDGDTIPMTVDQFTLDMMKEKNPSSPLEYKFNNVYDTCTFYLKFKFTIPAGTPISVTPASGIIYSMGVRFLNFSAIWGMFEPSPDMHAEDVVDMGKSWGKLDFLTRAQVPFAEPVVKADIVTQIAGALRLRDTYLFTLDVNKDTTYAEFSDTGTPESRRWFYKAFDPHEYLPLTSAIGDSSTNMSVTFNKEIKQGQIHKMFRKTPQKLGFRFFVTFDEMETPQIRITPNTNINVKTHCTLPFIFDQGVWIDYPDTTEVNLSQMSIDSIKDQAKVIQSFKSTNVKAVLMAKNTIPLHLKVTMRCFDANGNMIMDPHDKGKPFLIFPADTIYLDTPTMAYDYGKWSQTKPGETTMIAELDKEHLDMFPQIKKIVYKAILDDQTLDYAYKQGNFNVKLTEDNDVTIKVGLTANVEAVLNFNKK